MQSTFETLGGTYRQEGDYLIPNLEMPKSPAMGIWGQHHTELPAAHEKKGRIILSYNIQSK